MLKHSGEVCYLVYHALQLPTERPDHLTLDAQLVIVDHILTPDSRTIGETARYVVAPAYTDLHGDVLAIRPVKYIIAYENQLIPLGVTTTQNGSEKPYKCKEQLLHDCNSVISLLPEQCRFISTDGYKAKKMLNESQIKI